LLNPLLLLLLPYLFI